MKKKMSKKEAEEKIKIFFNSDKLDAKSVKKIKRLAMKYKIRLEDYRRRFCKECYSDLKYGKVRVSKMYKNVECGKCGKLNRWKIS